MRCMLATLGAPDVPVRDKSSGLGEDRGREARAWRGSQGGPLAEAGPLGPALGPVLGAHAPLGQHLPCPSSQGSWERCPPPLGGFCLLEGCSRADTAQRHPHPRALPTGWPPRQTLRGKMGGCPAPAPLVPASALLVRSRNTKGGNLFTIPPPRFISAAPRGAHASDSLPIVMCPLGRAYPEPRVWEARSGGAPPGPQAVLLPARAAPSGGGPAPRVRRGGGLS